MLSRNKKVGQFMLWEQVVVGSNPATPTDNQGVTLKNVAPFIFGWNIVETIRLFTKNAIFNIVDKYTLYQ